MQVDTMNKKIAAVEISYQESLSTALVWRSEGRLSHAKIDSLTKLFNDVDQAIQAMYVAKDLVNLSEFNTQQDKALNALKTIRALLDEKISQTGVVDNIWYFKSNKAIMI